MFVEYSRIDVDFLYKNIRYISMNFYGMVLCVQKVIDEFKELNGAS